MSNADNRIVQKIWSYCRVLRDEGLSYQDDLEHLTSLLYLTVEVGAGPVDEARRPRCARLSTPRCIPYHPRAKRLRVNASRNRRSRRESVRAVDVQPRARERRSYFGPHSEHRIPTRNATGIGRVALGNRPCR